MKSEPNFSTLPPLSLYLHFPWCVRKCPYCDFNSHQADDELPVAAYLDQLLLDLQQDSFLVQGRPIHSIFMGGGTPSLFPPEAMAELLQRLHGVLGWNNDIEITMEANPGTVEHGRFADYRAAGINRLSLGIQSFNEQHLKKLGRIHDRSQALSAIATARGAGFDNLNLDLMHGLPDQTPEQALEDLQQAIDLSPEHLSWYQLTIEPNTEFYRRPPEIPEDDVLWQIQKQGQELLQEAGYQQYEVSAYSAPSRQSQHNLNYWRFGDYLGLGAGAHGKLTDLASGQILRTRKTRMPGHYLQSLHPCVERYAIEPKDLPLEFMMNVLRLTDGVEKNLFTERTGLKWECVAATWKALVEKELVHKNRIQTTAHGFLFLNKVLESFMVD